MKLSSTLGFLLNELEVFVNGNTRRIAQKFKMAAVKPELYKRIHIVNGMSKLLYMKATKFQRLHLCFWGSASQWDQC